MREDVDGMKTLIMLARLVLFAIFFLYCLRVRAKVLLYCANGVYGEIVDILKDWGK